MMIDPHNTRIFRLFRQNWVPLGRALEVPAPSGPGHGQQPHRTWGDACAHIYSLSLYIYICTISVYLCYIWLYMVIHGYTWLYMVIHGYTLFFKVNF